MLAKRLMALIAIAATAMAGELQLTAGISMGFGKSVEENEMYDPHGRFSARYVSPYIEVYAEHLSAIPNPLDEWGVNMVGVNAIHTIGAFQAFAGYAKNITSGKGYVDDFSGDVYRGGIRRYSGSDKRIFIEFIDARTSLFSFGAEFIF